MKTQTKKQDIRQAILDAAREMFTGEGFGNVSMRKLAEKIGYSPTTIYLYFRDKTDILFAVCEDIFAQLSEKIAVAQKNGETPIDRLKSGLRAYVDFGIAHPNHYEMVFVQPPPDEEISNEGAEYVHEGSMGERAFSLLVAGVTECISAGDFAEKDAMLVSQSLWASIHGVTSLLIGHSHFPFVDHDKLIDSVINSAVRGWQA